MLVVNAHARKGRNAADQAFAALRSSGHSVIRIDASAPDDMRQIIGGHRGAIDAVVLGGGDGTLISAIDGVRDAGVPLAIIPLGTINELARTLALPFDVAAACALIDVGRLQPIDVGRANGTWFFNEASIGLSTHVVREQTGELKSRWGMFAIPIGTLRAIRHMRPHDLTVTWIGGTRSFHTVQLTVANSYRFGGVVENPDAAIDDGQLDLYSIDIPGPWAALEILAAVARKRFPASQNVSTIRASAFTVTAAGHQHRVFADGEEAGCTPVVFTIVPGALEVFVPR